MKTKNILVLLMVIGFECFIYAQNIPAVTKFVPHHVSIVEDIEYVSYQDKTLYLDLYRPVGNKEKLATIVVIRGGGFRIGDKKGFASMSAALANQGFATVCISYRTIDEALFPGPVLDSKSAVKWIHDHAETYNLNTNAIGVIGGSAGAHLSMMLATSGDVKSLNPNGSSERFKVNAAVVLEADADFSMATDDQNLIDWLGCTYEENKTKWKQASPITHIDKNTPPILFIHGADDPIVPIEQSKISMNKLIENEVYCELIALPKVAHGFWANKKWFEFTVKRAALFFKEQFKLN